VGADSVVPIGVWLRTVNGFPRALVRLGSTARSVIPKDPLRPLSVALLLVVVAGCGGGPNYGYARTYEPLGAEEPHYRASRRVTHEEVQRDPASYQGVVVGWFGVVTDVEILDETTGEALVAMDFRSHRDRHLCADERESSCRVTVSDATSGPFSARVQLDPAERAGEVRVWQGSLLKVYGSPTGNFDARGGPIIDAEYHRHWPYGTYRTTAAAGSMRR